MGIFTHIIGSVQIIRKIWTVKIFVVIVLSRQQRYYTRYHRFLMDLIKEITSYYEITSLNSDFKISLITPLSITNSGVPIEPGATSYLSKIITKSPFSFQ